MAIEPNCPTVFDIDRERWSHAILNHIRPKWNAINFYPTALSREECLIKSFSMKSTVDLNPEFSFANNSCITKEKEHKISSTIVSTEISKEEVNSFLF